MADVTLKELKLKNTKVAGRLPTTAQIAEGELAINLADKRLYSRNGDQIIEVGGTQGTVQGDFNQTQGNISTTGNLSVAGQTTLAGATNIKGKLTLDNPLAISEGGTGTTKAIDAAYNIGAMPIRGSVSASGVDLNTLGPNADSTGIWYFNTTDSYNKSKNIPEATNGVLEVFNGGAYFCTQKFTTRYGNIYTRSPTASWTVASPNYWGPWIPGSSNVQVSFFTGDLNTLLDIGNYAVTAAATNNPWPDTGGVSGRLTVETRTPNPTAAFGDLTQTFTIFTSSNANSNRVWKRTYQSSAGIWGQWNEFAQTGDSVGDNYIRNPSFLSGGFLQAISNSASATLEYVDNTDSRVPAGCPGARAAVITKLATGTLHQLNFGASNNLNTNYIPVAAGQILNFSVAVNGTGLTNNTQLRLVIVTVKGTTFVANNRVASYDGAAGGWQTLNGQFTVPADITQVYFGVWNETTAPANSVVCITEPSLKKQDPNLVAARDGTAIGTLTNTYRITQTRTDSNPPYITWNRTDLVDGATPSTDTQVGFIQGKLTASDGTPYGKTVGQIAIFQNATNGGGIVYLGARNASQTTTSQLKLDGDNAIATLTGALQVNNTITASSTINNTGTGVLGFNAYRNNSTVNSFYGAQTTAGQIFFGTGNGLNFVVNNSQNNSGAWLSMDGTTASFTGNITAPKLTLSSDLSVAGITTLGTVNTGNIGAGNITSTGLTSTGGLIVSGTSSLAGITATSLTNSGNLTVSGTGTFTNALNVTGVITGSAYVKAGGAFINNRSSPVAGNQGTHIMWNESSGQGEGSIVVNKGGGTGGFNIRLVNNANTTEDAKFEFKPNGTFYAPNGSFSLSGRIRTWSGVGAGYLQVDVDGSQKGVNFFDSDRNLKENIQDADQQKSIDIIRKLRPVSYKFKDTSYTTGGQEYITVGATHQYGIIAQEFEEILPEGIITYPAGNKAIDPLEMIGLLLSVCHTQQSMLDELKSRVDAL